MLKQMAKKLLSRAGLRVTRLPPNRFGAMTETLRQLRGKGYAPRVIIDGGANYGQWAACVRAVFPEPALHLIEPQPACHAHLETLLRADPRARLHPFVVTRPGITEVRLGGGGPQGGGSGAWVVEEGESEEDIQVLRATTLDALLAAELSAADRVLLKLDLEGHEISALEGAGRLLPSVEVIITEVQFFEVNANHRPTFTDVSSWLGAQGFELYDFAMLAARPRDGRLRMGDVVFVRRTSPLVADVAWA
jgi:FkbM family methyltransferase